MTAKEKQMMRFAKKLEVEVMEASRNEREHYLAVWSGFLTGMRKTNAITKKEYDRYFKQLQDLVKELDTAERDGRVKRAV